MNNSEIEEDLAKYGFTSKDIGVIRQNLGLNGATYPSLLNLLKKRFIFAVIFFIFLLLVTVHEIMFRDASYAFGCLCMWLVGGPVIWFMTPMRLGFKAFKYSLKNSQNIADTHKT